MGSRILLPVGDLFSIVMKRHVTMPTWLWLAFFSLCRLAVERCLQKYYRPCMLFSLTEILLRRWPNGMAIWQPRRLRKSHGSKLITACGVFRLNSRLLGMTVSREPMSTSSTMSWTLLLFIGLLNGWYVRSLEQLSVTPFLDTAHSPSSHLLHVSFDFPPLFIHHSSPLRHRHCPRIEQKKKNDHTFSFPFHLPKYIPKKCYLNLLLTLLTDILMPCTCTI